MKIVFLVINYMPHQLVSIKALIDNYNVEIHSFNYIDDNTTPVNIDKLHTYRLNGFNKNELLVKILDINPQMLVVAGWFVKEFVWIAKRLRKLTDIPIVVYSDTQWRSTFRQRVNCFLSPLHLKKAFTHIWVTGIYQFEYARKLGFNRNEIIFNALSCDVRLFDKVDIESKRNNYPKNFLYIGRFIKIKGLDYLIDAWNQIIDKKEWTLTLIGDGPLKETYRNQKNIIIKDFMNQSDLITEMKSSGAFILPSIFEQWALVLHEVASAGLPIIATEACGASSHFLINGFNGYQIKSGSVDSIKKSMEQIISLDKNVLIKFSHNSKKLANTITPEFGAANLMNLLNTKKVL